MRILSSAKSVVCRPQTDKHMCNRAVQIQPMKRARHPWGSAALSTGWTTETEPFPLEQLFLIQPAEASQRKGVVQP